MWACAMGVTTLTQALCCAQVQIYAALLAHGMTACSTPYDECLNCWYGMRVGKCICLADICVCIYTCSDDKERRMLDQMPLYEGGGMGGGAL